MLRKLQIKFVIFSMSIVTVMLCVIFALVFHFTRIGLEADSLHMMQTFSSDPMLPGAPYDMRSDVQLPFFSFQLTPQGEIIRINGGYYDLSDQEFLQELIDASLLSDSPTGVIPEYNLRFFHTSGPDSQYLIFSDMSSEINTLNNLRKNCFLIGGISYIVFLFISILLSRWAVKPVEQAWEQQRQFVSDASHELKTPLTIILTNAEMLQSGGCSPGVLKQFSENILCMSHQMQGLVESLLDLARMDNAAQLTRDKLDFSGLVLDALLPFEPLYYEKGLHLESRIESDISIKGSKSHLTQLISILLDNALKYAYPNTTVRIYLDIPDKKHCLLTVENPAKTISEADRKNIFKRFYRIDTARELNHSYGLGLPIARKIVSAHQGRIWCESAEETVKFFVKLPLYTRQPGRPGALRALLSRR